MVALALACTEEPGPPPSSDGPCAVDPDHPLRVVCAFAREAPGPVALVLGDRTWPGDVQALDVRIVAWDLLADTAYTFTLEDGGAVVARGTVRTGIVPADVDQALVASVDGPSSLERVVIPGACGGESQLGVYDGLGRLRGYVSTGVAAQVNGVDATDRGTLLALVGRLLVQEWAFDGTPVLSVALPEDAERPLHHAVIGRGGRTLALDTTPLVYGDGETYLMDGVAEVGPDGPVHLWGLDEVLDPVGIPNEAVPSYWATWFPEALDVAHANGVWPEPDGGWLLTLKHLDTLLRVAPDGSIAWAIVGSEAGAPFAAEALAFGGAFGYPHAPARTPEGTVLLLDNGRGGDTARVLELAIDEEARTADLVRAWELGVICPVQASAFALADGSVVAWCPNSRELFELDDGGIRRRSTLTCASQAIGSTAVRAVPFSW